MKQLLVWTLFGMIVSAPVAVQASDGAEALARWQQQFRQEQKKRTERRAGEQHPAPGEADRNRQRS
ncbi:hypothetical protein [Pseudomonas sp. ADAK13]|jgi:Ni/Co efflux regulator RcnB|uniref:hypothetical protein n=1 Tax=Pseudomonas sp. ADAK13 TaxID=2730847 RepID=UPI001463B9C7|nr:hypothetical protein [Pseudomonas sp. ADAK13]QJI37756.1 hypothetical protein HKK54_26230 [Pseudomonas sp. ADAK13]